MIDPTGVPDSEVTPTLQEAIGRRADLYHAILALEQAAARPAVNREGQWVSGVVEALGELEQEILEHIEITERHDGLYDEITEAAPRLGHKVQRLRLEHPEMLEATAALRARVSTTPPADAPSIDETRDEIQRVLGRLVKHRQLGADLVWEAYTHDLGGTG